MAQSFSAKIWFRFVIGAGGLFAFTTLAMAMSTFGDPEAPPNRFFSAYGLPLLIVEAIAVVVFSFLAMAVDRRETLAEQQSSPNDAAPVDDGKPGQTSSS